LNSGRLRHNLGIPIKFLNAASKEAAR
jgi:hypothetical protein